MKKKVLFFSIAIAMGLFVFLSSCSYTAPFREVEAVSPEAQVIVTLSAVGALAAALGPLIGSLLIGWFSWRMIFLVNVPIGLAVLGFGRLRLKETKIGNDQRGWDVFGTLLLIAGVSGIADGLAEAGDGAWTSQAVVLRLPIGILCLIGFLFHARTRADAALDLRLFDDSAYRWASAATLVLGIAFGMMFLAFYLFFTGVWHYSQSLAGLAVTPGPVLATIISIIVSKRPSAIPDSRSLLRSGGLLFALSNFWLSWRIGPEPDYFGIWLPGQIVGGIAIGLMLPSLAAVAVAGLPPQRLGTGSAVNTAIRQLGSALGVALTIALAGKAANSPGSFQKVYACLAVSGMVIAALPRGNSLFAEPAKHRA